MQSPTPESIVIENRCRLEKLDWQISLRMKLTSQDMTDLLAGSTAVVHYGTKPNVTIEMTTDVRLSKINPLVDLDRIFAAYEKANETIGAYLDGEFLLNQIQLPDHDEVMTPMAELENLLKSLKQKYKEGQ
jgi:hypothetical protein